MDVNGTYEFCEGAYQTTAWIKEHFNFSPSYISMIRAFIRRHPERYSYYAVSGKLTNVFAFIDAVTFFDAIKKCAPNVPPFDVETAARMFGRRSRK